MSRPLADRIVSEAIQNVGILEEGENRGKYIEVYQQTCVPPIPAGSPWCAALVVFRITDACKDLGIEYPKYLSKSGYTPNHVAKAKQHQQWVSVADAKMKRALIRPGDLVFFYFKQLGRIAHTGIVTSVNKWGVWTIEGNTAPEPSDELEVERDGDGVFKKKRTWSELGTYGGFVLIDD